MRTALNIFLALLIAIGVFTLVGIGTSGIKVFMEAQADPGYVSENYGSVVLGHQAGHTYMNKFGYNPDVADSFEPIWDEGDDYTYSAAAELLHFSSSDNGDDQTVLVQGLDANYALAEEEITLVGQTETAMTVALLRVYRAYVTDSTEPSGNIYIYSDDTVSNGTPQTQTKIRAKIVAGENQTNMCIYTIPDGFNGLLVRFSGGSSEDKTFTYRLRTREEGKVWRTKLYQLSYRAQVDHPYTIPLLLPEHTDIELEAKASVSGAIMEGEFAILLVAN